MITGASRFVPRMTFQNSKSEHDNFLPTNFPWLPITYTIKNLHNQVETLQYDSSASSFTSSYSTFNNIKLFKMSRIHEGVSYTCASSWNALASLPFSHELLSVLLKVAYMSLLCYAFMWHDNYEGLYSAYYAPRTVKMLCALSCNPHSNYLKLVLFSLFREKNSELQKGHMLFPGTCSWLVMAPEFKALWFQSKVHVRQHCSVLVSPIAESHDCIRWLMWHHFSFLACLWWYFELSEDNVYL